MSDKIGRNDLCVCGSGLKYKKCCGRVKKSLTQGGLFKVLQYLARTCEGGCFRIECSQIASVPDVEVLAIGYDVDGDVFEFRSLVPPPKPLIEIAKVMPVLMN